MSTQKTESALTALSKKQRTRKQIATRARRNPCLGQHARTAKMQATPRLTAGRKEEAKKVKGQGDKTPRKEKRRWKQQQQWKQLAIQTKYLLLPVFWLPLCSCTISHPTYSLSYLFAFFLSEQTISHRLWQTCLLTYLLYSAFHLPNAPQNYL